TTTREAPLRQSPPPPPTRATPNARRVGARTARTASTAVRAEARCARGRSARAPAAGRSFGAGISCRGRPHVVPVPAGGMLDQAHAQLVEGDAGCPSGVRQERQLGQAGDGA